jgi:protocatechuate 3,4-dioxygenase beta subunit
MNWFTSLTGSRRAHRTSARPATRKVALTVEALEDRRLLSCNVISGHVFQDQNDNGIFDAGEAPLADSVIELLNADGVVVGTATTDATGYYEFTADSTVDTRPTTKTVSGSFVEAKTNSQQQLSLPQFDPELGTLTGIEISLSGRITSTVKAENLDLSKVVVAGKVAGDLSLAGPGFSTLLTTTSATQFFLASAFDGSVDFRGTSGVSFAPKTVLGDKLLMLDDPDVLEAYLGTGSVLLTETATATSTATGGGNLVASIGSTGSADVTIVYHYIPSDCLRRGEYTIRQARQPAGFLDGRESSGGTEVEGSVGADEIHVTLDGEDLGDNDFGEITPASLGGSVYLDTNNDGVRDAGEAGIAGVTVRLTGTDDTGQAVELTETTDGTGHYLFKGLRPGDYQLSEVQPKAYLDGQDAAGSLGGAAEDDVIDNIRVGVGDEGLNYDFGELPAARLGGVVFHDANNNGVMDKNETGIAGATLRLTGLDDQGNAVELEAVTQADGGYEFVGLRPGTYTISEDQPDGYLDGKDRSGGPSGSAGDDEISGIRLQQGAAWTGYNFGEVKPASLGGLVYVDANKNGVKNAGELGLGGVLILLTGVDDRGNAVSLSTTTDINGAYRFEGLRPGTYALKEQQPAGYTDGKESLGSLGGKVGNDQFTAIVVGSGQDGANYNFGEIAKATGGSTGTKPGTISKGPFLGSAVRKARKK